MGAEEEVLIGSHSMVMEGEVNDIKLGYNTIPNQYFQSLANDDCYEYFFASLFMFLY